MSDADPNAPADVAAFVAAELKLMFAEVVRSDIDVADKARWHQRLIAITNTAKRDVVPAAEQLRRAQDEWKMFRTGNNDAG